MSATVRFDGWNDEILTEGLDRNILKELCDYLVKEHEFYKDINDTTIKVNPVIRYNYRFIDTIKGVTERFFREKYPEIKLTLHLFPKKKFYYPFIKCI